MITKDEGIVAAPRCRARTWKGGVRTGVEKKGKDLYSLYFTVEQFRPF